MTDKVTQADRDLVFELCYSAARSEMEKLAIEYIRDGKGDDAEAVQMVVRHRTNTNTELVEALRAVAEEAEFLCNRLDELDWSMSYDDFGNNYNGHVDPSHSRLKGFLEALSLYAGDER